MADIRLAGNLIENLGFFGFNYGHLQLVFVDGSTQLENEVQAPNFLTIPFGGDWQYPPIRDHTATGNTSNFGVADEYAATILDIGDRNPADVWNILTQVRANFVTNGGSIDYDFGKNSNSYATSLLYTIGISVTDVIAGATPVDVDRFPGSGNNVLLSDTDAFSLNIIGTESNDIIYTGIRDDIIKGGVGDDELFGSDGIDTAVFSGKPADYDIFLNDDGTWTSRHIRGDADEGIDTLTNVEMVEFEGGQKFSLQNNGLTFQTDFAFVVDQTGSMSDDIAAVKASATALIDALFAGDATDARIGVVGFRDNTIGEPTQVFLPFTDQDDFADRKAAALAAINSLGASGGGDEPETAFDGLLKALDGSIGDWRESAGTKRVALFTDASAKDAFLLPTVLGFANDIGAVISARSSVALSTFGSVDTFELSFEGESGTDAAAATVGGTATVQIYTIFIDTFIDPDPNLVEVAEASGGELLLAADPAEVVERLLEVITGPENSLPVAIDDAFAVGEDQTLIGDVLADNGNGADFDSDTGDTLGVTLVSGPADGELTLNSDGTFTYAADADTFDVMAPGTSNEQTFIYELSDGNGGSAQATAKIEVAIVGDGETFKGTNRADEIIGTDGGEDLIIGKCGNDKLYGLDGADSIYGNNGRDRLYGGESVDKLFGGKGADKLFGGDGNDLLYGGRGNDILSGGEGSDQFWFGRYAGRDTVTDFEIGQDLIVFSGLGKARTFTDVESIQCGSSAIFKLANNTITLENIDATTLSESDFLFV